MSPLFSAHGPHAKCWFRQIVMDTGVTPAHFNVSNNSTSLSYLAHEAHLKVGMAVRQDMLPLQSCSRNRSTEWLQPTPR